MQVMLFALWFVYFEELGSGAAAQLGWWGLNSLS